MKWIAGGTILLITIHCSLCSFIHETIRDAESAVRHHLIAKRSTTDSKQIRQKRQMFCVLGCVQSLAKNLESEAAYKEASGGLVSETLFNKTQFEAICRKYKVGKECIDECEFTPLKSTLSAAFKSLDYLCITHYDDFLEYVPCYQSSVQRVSEECNPKCGEPKEMVALKARQEVAKKEGNLNEMSNILDCMCEFLKCQLSCQVPIYNDVCSSDDPGVFLTEFSQSTFSALQNLMMQNGVGALWPQQCRDIADNKYKIDLPEIDGGLQCLKQGEENVNAFLFRKFFF